MKILHISASAEGGAGIAARRIHLALLEAGVESKMIVKSKLFNYPKVEFFKIPPKVRQEINFSVKFRRKIHRLAVELKLQKPFQGLDSIDREKALEQSRILEARDKRLGMFSYAEGNRRITEILDFKAADIIHLHWVPGVLDWPTFFNAHHTPIVYTLHDAFPFSGGKHVLENFGDPQINGLPQTLRFNEIEDVEDKKVKETKIIGIKGLKKMDLVAPSNWIRLESSNSDLMSRFMHHQIFNICPINFFKPFDKKTARQLLEISCIGNAYLFIADAADSYHKGLAYFLAAARSFDSNTCILIVGKDEIQIETEAQCICLGKIYEERYLALVYSAADFLILPSLADNLPNTMLEALCCGLPVIGFPVGGIPEVVGEQYGNGIICDEISVGSLIDAIEKGIKAKPEFDSEQIAKRAAAMFNPQTIANQHIALYKSILESKNAPC